MTSSSSSSLIPITPVEFLPMGARGLFLLNLMAMLFGYEEDIIGTVS